MKGFEKSMKVAESVKVQVTEKTVDGLTGEKSVQLLQEHPMEIYVNEQLFARLVCTASDLENLVTGRLVTEGILSDISEMDSLRFCASKNRARVYLRGDVSFERKEETEPTCCTENHVYLQLGEDKLCCGGNDSAAGQERKSWKEEWIFGIANAFAEDSKLHRSTGGTHSCMLAVEDRILYRAEDIGRHNALDKAIGYAVRNGLDRKKCILFTTGRVPVDMAQKVIRAEIPVLVSKSVPTADAVDMARAYGLTLICRAWPDSFEVYA